MNTLLKFLIVLFLIAGGLFYALQMGVGYVGATAIEQMGSRAMNATVTVENVSVSIAESRIDISGLNLADMEGFGTDDSVAVEDISITVDRESLGGDVVTLQALSMDAPVFSYTVPAGAGDLGPIIAKVQQMAAQGGAGGGLPSGMPSGMPSGAPGSGMAPPINIQNLNISNGMVSLNVGGQAVSVPMPDIQMQNLGGGSGASAMAVAQSVMSQMMANSASVLAGLDLNALAQGAGGGSGTAGQLDAGKRALENLSGEAAGQLRQLMDQ